MTKKAFLLGLMVLLALLTVIPAFAQTEEPMMMPDTLNLGANEMLGDFLVASNGMTLYTFKRDALGMSACVDGCAATWPPLTVESADDLTLSEGIPGEIGTIERADGTLQVTYNEMPLYFYASDMAPGDAMGHNFRNNWTVMPPATVYIKGNAELGSFLVGANGMTVYEFTNDEPGVSNCSGGCAEAWPPLTVESENALVAGSNLRGALGVIEREDGALQVTYNDVPLYYWNNDAARGEATGEGVGDVWYTIAPEIVTMSSNDMMESFLVAPNGFTLYTFANDEAGVSNCVDNCATNWPPLTTAANERLVAGAGIEGELATIERADGTLQVTYNGMPLYTWVNDAAPGETSGDGVGGVWMAAQP